jgi:hypothetical protein
MDEFGYLPLSSGALCNQSLGFPLSTELQSFDTTRHDEQRQNISSIQEKQKTFKKSAVTAEN